MAQPNLSRGAAGRVARANLRCILVRRHQGLFEHSLNKAALTDDRRFKLVLIDMAGAWLKLADQIETSGRSDRATRLNEQRGAEAPLRFSVVSSLDT